MRWLAILLAAVMAVVALTGCGSQQPHLWIAPAHHHTFAACASSDCGIYSAVLHWQIPTFPGQTGYWIFLNGTQGLCTAANGCVDTTTQTSYLVKGMDCGQSYTIGIEAHDASNNFGRLWTLTHAAPACPSPFPLAVSSNGRYLQDSSASPWLMVGDSPQSLIGDNSVTTANSYLDDRQAHNFNTAWINLLCDGYTFCPTDGKSYNDANSTADNLAPFTTGTSPSTYDLSTPNAAYFSRAHQIIAHAQADGIEVMLDPIETGGCQGGGWITTLENNGDGTYTNTATKDYQYGVYLGNTFKDLNNITWLSGNDFYCLGTATDSNDALAVAKGIKSVDPTALQSLEPQGSGAGDKSTDYANWSSFIDLNLAYSYAPSYAEDRSAYAATAKPAFLGEANYDGEHLQDGCNVPAASVPAKNCRLQEWWTMTSGATGQLYGSYWTDAIGGGSAWNTHGGVTNTLPGPNAYNAASIDSVPVTQLGYQTSLLRSIAWQDLVPDTTNTLVTSPANNTTNCPASGLFQSSACVTDAETADKTLGLVYDAGGSSVTVALTQMVSSPFVTTARWYDPTNGTYTAISGSPFADTGPHTFTTPGTNSASDSDWVLLLQASP